MAADAKGSPLVVQVGGKTLTLYRAAAEKARRLFKFAQFYSDEDFTGLIVSRIVKGELVEFKFEPLPINERA